MIPSAAARDLSERARAQRQRILAAAHRCFAERGFHAASMADIAKAAGMSAGLLYRYFDSKSAIVRAIIDRQMEENRCLLDGVASASDLGAVILQLVERWMHQNDAAMGAALSLEMAAEAVRDPEIGEAIRAADATVRVRIGEALRRILEAGHGDNGSRGVELDPAIEHRRVLELQCLIEGLMVRAVRQPDLDRATLEACIADALAGFERG